MRFELSPATYATVQEALTKLRRDSGGALSDDEALLLMARHVLGGPSDEGRSSYQIAISMCPSCERHTIRTTSWPSAVHTTTQSTTVDCV